ncbi:MAG: hypothetical protein ACLUZ0_04230 [Coprococcus sp.]
MSGFQCPYCSMVMSISPFTYVSQSPSFSFSNGEAYKKENGETVDPSTLRIAFYKCPNCGQISINALGIGTKVKDVNMQIRPISLAKHYPEYIPENIRKDYEEACAIVDLSPKASAFVNISLKKFAFNSQKAPLFSSSDAPANNLIPFMLFLLCRKCHPSSSLSPYDLVHK